MIKSKKLRDIGVAVRTYGRIEDILMEFTAITKNLLECDIDKKILLEAFKEGLGETEENWSCLEIDEELKNILNDFIKGGNEIDI